MSDTVKHSDDEEIVTLTYTWGQVKNFLHEHGRPATTRNAEALVAACGRGNRIENGMDSLFNGAYDEVEGQLYEALTDDLPDKPWYDRPNGKWVYDVRNPLTTTTKAKTNHGMARTAMSANIRAGTNAGAATPAPSAEGTCANHAPSVAARAAASSATTTRTKPRTANGSASNAN